MTSPHPLTQVALFSAQPYDEAFFSKYADTRLDIHFYPAQLNASTVDLAKNCSVVCVFVNDKVDDTVIRRLAEMGCTHIALRCAGYNNVDISSAAEHQISVSRVPAYSPEAVAEHAVALILTLNRKLHKAYNRVRESNFDLNGLLGFTLHNKTVGIVGSGNIGKATAKILLGFGCNMLCVDPYPDAELSALGVNYVDYHTLLSNSDIISLHCPLNEKSYHMIDEVAIGKMKTGVMLVNTSRGGLIDTHAVIQGLKSQKIGYLGLDVYEMESELFFKDHSSDIIQDDLFERLSTFHNVLITGHQGFFTEEALEQITTTTINNILSLSHDKTLTAYLVS